MKYIAMLILPILLSSCSNIERELARHDEIVYSSDGVHVAQSCMSQHPLRNLPELDRYTFAVNIHAEPFLYAFSGLYYSTTPFIIITMGRVNECRRVTTIYFEGSNPENLTFRSVENWPEIAGSSVVQAFDELNDECTTLSNEEIYSRYGFAYWRDSDGTSMGSNNHFVSCETGILSHAYAVRISGIKDNPGSLIVSNVYGQIFVDEEE